MTLSRELLDAVESLNKGLGVRKRDLREKLGPLRRTWQIETTNAPEVMARTIIRVRQSVADLDAAKAEIARVSYNLDPDPVLNPLNHGDRIEELSKRLGKGNAVRTLDRVVAVIRDHIAENLKKPWQPISPDEIRSVLDQERNPAAAGARSAPGPGIPTASRATPLSSSITIMQGPQAAVDYVVQRFLVSTLLVPHNDEHVAAVADMASFGSWTCAFEDVERLDAYRRAAKPDWGGTPLNMTGAELIAHLRRCGRRVGILVNPLANPDGDLTGTLPMPPELIEQLQQAQTSEQ